MTARVNSFVIVGLVAASLYPSLLASEPQAGFPLLWQIQPGKVAVADVTGDGLPEVVISRWLDVVIITSGGTFLPGWPFRITAPITEAGGTMLPPLVGDIDGDGALDVVFEATHKKVYALGLDGQLKPGWPVQVDAPGLVIQHICLGDLDNDGDLEILVGDGSQLHGVLFAYDGNGQYHPGFPRVFEEVPAPFAIAGVAVGDLEFDGTNEIVVGFAGHVGGWIPSPAFVLNGDGTTRAGWPAYPPGLGGALILANPAIADMDEDLTAEIAGNFGEVFLMNHDASAFAAPYQAFGSGNIPLALADVDSDGTLEVVSGGTELTVWKPFVGVIAQTPSTDLYWYYAAVAVADFDGDGLSEIAAWTAGVSSGPSTEFIHLLDLDMNQLPGWPKSFPPWTVIPPRTIAIADLDGDNDLELIHPHEGALHVWDVENPGSGVPRVEWSMLGHDASNARFYHNGNIPRRRYLRGDANRSGLVDTADAMAILEYLYFGETTPCPAQNDFDLDGVVSMVDAICVLQYLFLMGSPPAQPPFPNCDVAPLGEALPCTTSACP
ncbi:MAG: FG-GAP-like repeat-containing protein [Planctomycetota bacterium]